MNEKKLGGGILTVSILYLIFLGIGIIGTLISFLTLDVVNSAAAQIGMPEITASQLIISLVISILTLIGVILIMMKNKVGIYTFFTLVAISFIYSIVLNGFTVSALLGLILPVLMGIFVYLKRDIYGFEVKDKNLDA